MTSLEAEVTALVRQLEPMGLPQLRAEWQGRYGAPPTLRSPDLLRRLLAWRIQADAFGGLEPAIVRRIHKAARARGVPAPALAAGSKLAREWQGVVHEVEATDEGFVYAGRRYRSLSAVARQITGAR